MKSYKQHITEMAELMDLINKYDNPYEFLSAVMKAISDGKIKLKTRGAANAREVVAVWNRVKTKKIKVSEAIKYISEGRRDLEKGWTLKNKIVISTNDYDYYHIKQIIKEPRKFGLDKRKILKILADSAESMSVPNPEAYVEDQYESLADGIVDNDVYIEEYIMKKGYCRFVIDKTHGSIEGWNEKNCKLGAKALDDTYLPYERDGFKLFEVKPLNPFKPKYITSKFDWYDWLEGKAKRKYVSPMAQFREETLKEELPTKEIDSSEFPNPLSSRLKAIFQMKGDMDGSQGDDIVKTKARSWSARKLKPSQSAIYLGKSLGMAVGGVKGGDLGSIVSSDKHILDGHHRWAATLLSEPSAKITGIEANLGIGDLVPVLRALGDSLHNSRRGEPTGGDINIFQAKIGDAMMALTTGKNMNPKFYNKEKSLAWLESIGGRNGLAQRLKELQSHRPPKGAPPRIEMPVIDADKGDEKLASTLLRTGKLDVRKPYARIKK